MPHRRTLAIASALLLVPAVVAAQDPAPLPSLVADPAPPRDDASDKWNAPVFTSGALVFAASYGTSVIVAGSHDHPGDSRLDVPIVGPWLDLADRGPGCPVLSASCGSQTTGKLLLVADGIFQAAGILTMLDGVLATRRHEHVIPTATRDYQITPTTVQGDPGIAVSGHF